MALRRAVFLALVALLVTTGVVYAAFTVAPLANGIASESEMRDFVKTIKETRQIDTTQMRILDVTLTDAAGTGWHTHPGTPSLIVVKSGQINYLTPDGAAGCTTRTLNPGEMIFHPSSLHDLRPVGSSAVFTAVYFSSPGVVLTNPTTGPC